MLSPRAIKLTGNRYSFAAIGVVFIVFAFFYGRPVIQNDGISYYALALSLVQDHDFDLGNQYQEFPEVRVIKHSPVKEIASYYSCGFGFLYAPVIWTMDRFNALRTWSPYAQNVRFPFSHAFGIFLGSIFYSFLSVTLGYLFLVRNRQLPPLPSLLISLALFVATPLAFYTFTVPSFAHAADAFLMAGAFSLLMMRSHFRIAALSVTHLLLGVVLAFSVMFRNNNVVIVPVMLVAAVFLETEKSWQKAFQICLEIFVGALPILIVHALFNFDQYGRLFATGYAVNVTGQQAETRFFRFFWIFFHPVAGLYPWSPVTLLATVGLILSAIKKQPHSIIALAIVLVVIVSIRFAAVIFPGASFGQRLLTHLYICWVIGLAEFYLRFKKLSGVLIPMCVLWSFLLFNTYFILTGSRESKVMTQEGGASPIAWIQTSIDAYQQKKENGEVSNPCTFWYQNLGARPYPVLLHVLWRIQ
jgi:hypothetical protein